MTEFLLIGGGIVGLTLARALQQQGAHRITVLEKEPQEGMHASGRNSGVLHAGIYYPSDTLKAQFCQQGSQRMQRYCEEQGLPLSRHGKVIVTRNEAEQATLTVLYERAMANGAKVEFIDEQQLADYEPLAKTCGRALYSPHTAIVDPKIILAALKKELMQHSNIQFRYNTQFLGLKNKNTALTSQGPITFQRLINCAGAYADIVARRCGFNTPYYLIPFKGIYYQLAPEQAHRVHANIYPVPSLQNPFLGVHFTKNIYGDVYIGPTAIPALGRENYGILKGISKEAPHFLWQSLLLCLHNPAFRNVALKEPRQYIKKYFYQNAKQLVKELKPEWIKPCHKVGIRPQLINKKTHELMMDFLVEEHDNQLHVLNAISPAFTCSLPFADYLVKRLLSPASDGAAIQSPAVTTTEE